jgi:hypothetical protein
MFEKEEALIRSNGINVDHGIFPYSYFDAYILACNPDIQSHAELVYRLELLKSQVDPDTYELTILHGAVINLMRDYHYDFIVAMIKHKQFCDWILSLNLEFEIHHDIIEKITNYRFD